MNAKIFVLFALVAFVAARPNPQESDEPAKYEFDWKVEDAESSNDFGHNESRDGDNISGSYYVVLPDTRKMIVTYTVTAESGFVADVQFEGEAVESRK